MQNDTRFCRVDQAIFKRSESGHVWPASNKVLFFYSSQMATAAVKKVQREAQVWVCGGAEGRHAT